MSLSIRKGLRAGAVLAAALIAALTVAACAGDDAAAVGRTIYMSALEPKGGATVDKELFPTQALPPGGGYVLKAPDATGRWEVSAYEWSPGVIVVRKGEKVTLNIVGINGTEHPSSIENYVPSFNVKRGQLTTLSFDAKKTGIFQIVCQIHQPSMVGHLVVLPK